MGLIWTLRNAKILITWANKVPIEFERSVGWCCLGRKSSLGWQRECGFLEVSLWNPHKYLTTNYATLVFSRTDTDVQRMVNLRNQERIEQTFGVYVGEVEDGKPHGQGVCNFNKDDIIVSENELKLHITNFFFFLYMVFNDTHIHWPKIWPG